MLRNIGLVAVAFGACAFAFALLPPKARRKLRLQRAWAWSGMGVPRRLAAYSGRNRLWHIYVLWNRPYDSKAPVPDGVAKLQKNSPRRKRMTGCRHRRLPQRKVV